MIPPLDVFAMDAGTEPMWLGPAHDLEDAKLLMLAHLTDGHGVYLVKSQLTGNCTNYEIVKGQLIEQRGKEAAAGRN